MGVCFGELSRIFLGLLHESISCVLQNGLWTLATPRAHGNDLVLEIFT